MHKSRIVSIENTLADFRDKARQRIFFMRRDFLEDGKRKKIQILCLIDFFVKFGAVIDKVSIQLYNERSSIRKKFGTVVIDYGSIKVRRTERKEVVKMKKYLNISLGYAIAAMVGGVFYREFTKFNAFTGVTTLGKVHTHLFLLGMMMFLLVALFAAHSHLEEQKLFRNFFVIYNIGVPLTAVMLLVRGIPQVMGLTLSTGINAAISGIAGIGHILTGIGIVLLILSLKKIAKN